MMLWPFSRRRKMPPSPKRICIIKLWAVGESIVTLPMIKSIHERFPEATIDVIVRERNRVAYTGQPFINEVLSLPQTITRPNHYDICIDCEPYLNMSAILSYHVSKFRIGFDHGIRRLLYDTRIFYRDDQNFVLTYMDLARPLGITSTPTSLVKMQYSDDDKKSALDFIRANGVGDKDRVIGIGAGTAESGHSRRWPAEKYAQLCDRLVSDGFKIVFVGAPFDKTVNEQVISMMKEKRNVIDAAGRLSLRAFFALVERFDAMVSNDTGSMHIAAAQGVRTLGIFCPTDPAVLAPFGKGNAFVYKPVIPTPCINVHKGQTGTNCAKHNHMSLISVDDVYSAAKELVR